MALIEGLIEVKYLYGKHKTGWKSRHVSVYPSDDQVSSGATLAISERNDAQKSAVIPLVDVVCIKRVHFRRKNFAFLIDCKEGTQVFLNGTSETVTQKWMQILRSALMNVGAPSFISMPDVAEATTESCTKMFPALFPVAVIDNINSSELGIGSYYILQVSSSSLSLLDCTSHLTVQKWPLSHIERFSIPSCTNEDWNKIFSIHVVRQGICKTYSYFVEDARGMLELVKEVILRKVDKISEKRSVISISQENKRDQDCSIESFTSSTTSSASDIPGANGDEEAIERKLGLLRPKSSTLSRKNAIRNRSYTGQGQRPHIGDDPTNQRKAFSAYEGYLHKQRGPASSDKDVRAHTDNRATLGSTESFKKTKKTSGPVRTSHFYINLNDPDDIQPNRNSQIKNKNSDGYLHKKHLSMPDVQRSLEINTSSITIEDETVGDLDSTANNIYHARGHSLPETEWIIPDEITVPKSTERDQCDLNLLSDGHQTARRRISTASNIYFDLDIAQNIEKQDVYCPDSDSGDTDRYKKNLQKFLGIPDELKDPLSAPPALPARPKTLPQALKKTTKDDRHSLRDVVVQTLKKNRNKHNSDSLTEDYSSDESSESDDTKVSTPTIVPISSWPISCDSEDNTSRKVALQNELYSTSQIYMNHDICTKKDSFLVDIAPGSDHIYSSVPDDFCSHVSHTKSLGDLLQEFDDDFFNWPHELSEQKPRSRVTLYENISQISSIVGPSPKNNGSIMLTSSATSLCDNNSESRPLSLDDSEYLSMDQLQLDTVESSLKVAEVTDNPQYSTQDTEGVDDTYMEMEGLLR